MRNLKSLNAYGRSLVKRDFLSTDQHRVSFSDDHFSETAEEFDFDAVSRILNQAKDRYPAGKAGASMDVEIAPALHRVFPLHRRTASETGVWHYLATVEFEEFVRYRWGHGENGMVSQERFLGSLKRNALGRLWWAAELTMQDEGDYSATKRLLAPPGGQDLLEQVLGRRFSNFKPASIAYVQLVGGKPRRITRAVAETLSQTLMTVVLEALVSTDVEELILRILHQIEASE